MKKKLFSMLLVFTLVLSMLMPDISANAAKKIKLNKKEINIEVGETFKLVLKNAKAKKVQWFSHNKKVATVSDGTVKGLQGGDTYITAKYKNKEYLCQVYVIDNKIELNETEVDLDVNNSFQLVLKNADAKNVKWSSEDEEVATVSSNGIVKGISDGLIVITAKYKGKKYKCEVNVTDWYNEDDEYEEDDEDWDDDDWDDKDDDNYSDNEIKIDTSSFNGLVNDGFLFMVKTTSGLSHSSLVCFESVDYDVDEYNNVTINYKAYSKNAIESSFNLVSDLAYKFTYKVYDDEGYIVKDGDFWLPKMYIGGKVKDSFRILGLKPGSYRLSISADYAY